MSETPTNKPSVVPFVPLDQRKMMVKAGLDPFISAAQGDAVAMVNAKAEAHRQAENDARVLALLIARVQKAIGNNMQGHVVMGALVHILSQVVVQTPVGQHAQVVQNIVNGLDACICATYSPEYLEKLRQLREAQMVRVSDDVISQMADAIAEQQAAGGTIGSHDGEITPADPVLVGEQAQGNPIADTQGGCAGSRGSNDDISVDSPAGQQHGGTGSPPEVGS